MALRAAALCCNSLLQLESSWSKYNSCYSDCYNIMTWWVTMHLCKRWVSGYTAAAALIHISPTIQYCHRFT